MRRPIVHSKERERCAERARRRVENTGHILEALHAVGRSISQTHPECYTTITVSPADNTYLPCDWPWGIAKGPM